MTERLSRSFAEWDGRTSQAKTWAEVLHIYRRSGGSGAGGSSWVDVLKCYLLCEMPPGPWLGGQELQHHTNDCNVLSDHGKVLEWCPNVQMPKDASTDLWKPFGEFTVHCPPREPNELTIGCAFHRGTHKSLPRTVGAHQIAEVWGVSDSEPWPQMVGDESQILWFYGSDRPKNGYLLDRWSLYSAETLFQRCWVSNNFSLCPQPNMSCDLIATSACSPMPSTSVHKKCVARTRTASIGLKISPIRLVFVFSRFLLPKQGPIQGFCWPMDGSYWVILVKPCKHKTRSETFNLLPICRFQV